MDKNKKSIAYKQTANKILINYIEREQKLKEQNQKWEWQFNISPFSQQLVYKIDREYFFEFHVWEKNKYWNIDKIWIEIRSK